MRMPAKFHGNQVLVRQLWFSEFYGNRLVLASHDIGNLARSSHTPETGWVP